jgi:transcriptional regulator with XRE-family HTH domain
MNGRNTMDEKPCDMIALDSDLESMCIKDLRQEIDRMLEYAKAKRATQEFTTFGLQMRRLRIAHHEILYDTAKMLGVSTVAVSKVECNMRKVPVAWIQKIIEHYGMNEDDVNEFMKAVEMTNELVEQQEVMQVGERMLSLQAERKRR